MIKDLVCAVEQLDDYRIDQIRQSMNSVISQGAKSIMFLCCDTEDDLSFLNVLLPKFQQPVFGGLFPELIWQGEAFQRGCLILGLSEHVSVQLVTHVSNQFKCTPTIEVNDQSTLLVFIDGLSSNIEACTQKIYDWVGNSCHVLGAGAGSLSLQQKPCIINNSGLHTDAVVLVSLPFVTDITIAHGWQRMAGPFLVTQVDGNQIKEINFQPAFEIYQQQVEEHSDIKINKDNFFQHASSFPLGIDRLDDDMLIRDPIKVSGSDVICVGAVPENGMIYFLTAQPEHLISAAKNSISSTLTNTELVLSIDCVSRKLFLQHDFDSEIAAIESKLTPYKHFITILALGEIASGKFGAINFHNKTSVVGQLSAKDCVTCSK